MALCRLSILLLLTLALRAADFAVTDFGAVGDAKTLCTISIQKTIDAASSAGGGRVVFGPGTYVTGALFLKSHVELHLEKGVTLSAVRDDAAYPDIPTRIAGIEMPWPAAVVNIYGQVDVKITGKGIIDGQGDFWWKKFWGNDRKGGMVNDYSKRGLRWAADYDCKRVRAVALYQARDSELRDFTIRRSGFWSLVLTYCERISVDGIVIQNNIGGIGPSSDGIDIDSSRDILVQHCDIDCNDDNICLKSGRDFDGLRVNRPTENIIIRDCITRAGHGMITLGSETSGGIRKVEVSNMKALGTKYGIRFKSARIRGGVVENIRIHDVDMKDVAHPFHVELNWYPSYSYPTLPPGADPATIPAHWKTLMQRVEPVERGIPLFRDIEISNVKATGAEEAFVVNAFEEKPIANVILSKMEFEAKRTGSIKNARNWIVKDVVIKSTQGEALTLQGCVNVELPTVKQSP